MATGWSITVGYVSGETFDGNQTDAWELLRKRVISITQNQDQFVSACVYTTHNIIDRDQVAEVCSTYKIGELGNPLTINDDEQYILIIASGGGDYRPIKEYVARNVCQMVMWFMHEHGIDISITVA